MKSKQQVITPGISTEKIVTWLMVILYSLTVIMDWIYAYLV